MFGIATIANGSKVILENQKCIASIQKQLPAIETITLSLPLDTSDSKASRLTKTSLINSIPSYWQYCVYLDSDTRVISPDLAVLFDILSDGFDLVICPSQHNDFWHIDKIEQEYTYDLLEYVPVQLQGGMFGFAVNAKTHDFFLRWSNEYRLYSNQDQAALIRCLHGMDLKIWLMGFPFNSSNGSVVNHLFGNTR